MGVLDTRAEHRFDNVTRLAQLLFDVPMVSVTLVDADRQWRKSFQGPLRREEPGTDSFCHVAVKGTAPLIVPDALTDQRFQENRFVTGDPHLRFYAGVPLRAPTGEAVGTFCLFDTEPRELADAQLEMLNDLARYVESELSREAEMERAMEVQLGLLPKRAPQLPGFGFAAALRAARRVGGDFYDWYRLGDDVVLSVADVMGKGMGAALLAATVRGVLRGVGTGTSPAEDLSRVGRILMGDLDEAAAFVTVFQARIGPDGTVRYADAGHGLSLLVGSGRTELLETTGMPLGLADEPELTDGSARLGPGEVLVTCSDGLFDALGGTRASLDRIADAVRGSASPDAAVQALLRLVEGRPVDDDLTIVAVLRDPS
jgi:hypothetical protein